MKSHSQEMRQEKDSKYSRERNNTIGSFNTEENSRIQSQRLLQASQDVLQNYDLSHSENDKQWLLKKYFKVILNRY